MKTSFIQKTKELQREVEQLLIKYPQTRDSDNKLACYIWWNRVGVENIKTMTAMDFLKKYSLDELPSQESIGRARRKLQENNPNLRGEKWLERQLEQENTRKKIKEL